MLANKCYWWLVKVKVTAPNGFSTIARALIDPGSSTSFVHERIAQHLRLPRSKKNVMVEGVGGTSTPTRGSVWFQVSGVEDDYAEKIRVEAYMLKKITKDLPLHPISLALKWDHLSDLELADTELRIPARIDMLLGAEVSSPVFFMTVGRLELEACYPQLILARMGAVRKDTG